MKSLLRLLALLVIAFVWVTFHTIIKSKRDSVLVATVSDSASNGEGATMEIGTPNLEAILVSSFKSNQSVFCGVVVQLGVQATAVVVDFTRNISSPIIEPIAFYSVLAVATNYHIVGGVYETSQAYRFHTETTFRLSIVPNATYELLVHELDRENRPEGKSRLLCSIQFSTPHFPLSPRSILPMCHTSRSVLPWDGQWVGPKFPIAAGSAPLRTGWSYVPNDCNLKTYTAPEIHSLLASDNTTKTIVVLGSSIERGIFLSLLDIIVDTVFKEDLAQSKTGKCWGRASVQVGTLEIVYQDFRAVYMDPDADAREIQCHGDKLALGPGLYFNATLMLTDMFKASQNWPEIIFMSMAHSSRDKLMSIFLEQIPKEWEGKFILGFSHFSGRDIFSDKDIQQEMARAKETYHLLNDKRVHFLDTMHVVSAMRLQTEKIGRIAGSNHFHRFCREGDIFVCSNVTEAIAQLLLGTVVDPSRKLKSWPKSKSSIMVTEPLMPRICTDCPARLLPFHIKPEPELTCIVGAFEASESAGEIWSDVCPAFCLNVPANGSVLTQSGSVEVRTCYRID